MNIVRMVIDGARRAWWCAWIWTAVGTQVVAQVSADTTHTLQSGGRERSYIVHVPPGEPGERGRPVVIAFHGGGSNAEIMIRFSGLNAKSDAAGFIAVYPNGTGRLPLLLTFNGGNCCGFAFENNVDDVAFVNALIDDLAGRCKVDLTRVYATGMSNGGIMCYLLASKLAHRIAAIAPVAGTMGTGSCEPTRPVPVMHFHGTADQFLCYEGGSGRRSLTKTDFVSVDRTIRAWVKADGCEPAPREELLPDTADDGMRVRRYTYSGGRQGAEVILFRIEGGGHSWPGGPGLERARFLGPTCKDISANDLMWEFFKKYSL